MTFRTVACAVRGLRISNQRAHTSGTLMAGALLVCSHVPSAAQSGDSEAKALGSSEIIVTGKQTRNIAKEDIADYVPQEVINAYAADSIGELLARLSVRFGPQFSILVNGRRLASTDAINALPPEALNHIEVLLPVKAQQYGFPSGETVVNLALKSKFDTVTIEGAGSISTEGAGDTERAASRYARIRGDNRISAAVTYSHQGGIRQKDRSRNSVAGAGDRSLTAASDSVMLTGGYAQPIGSLNLDVSAELGYVHTRALTGLIADTLGGEEPQASYQHSEVKSTRSGATLSGYAGAYFWSLLVDGERTWTSIESQAGQAGASGVTQSGSSIESASTSLGATITSGGTLLNLPAGPATIDGTFAIRSSTVTTLATIGAMAGTQDRYSSLSAQTGVTVPILSRGTGFFGALGDVTLGERFDHSQVNGFGNSFAITSSLDWTIAPGLRTSISRASSPGVPAAGAIYAPIVRRPDTLVYDVVSRGVVPVTIVTGGRSDLARSTSSSTSFLIDIQKGLSFANVSASINYTMNDIDKPLVSISNPSPLAQQLLPSLFARDETGALTEFDARPFTGLSEKIRQIDLTLRVGGRMPSDVPDAIADETVVRTVRKERPGPVWDLAMTYSHALVHQLDLGIARGSIDLLSNPLGLSGSARSRMNLQWAVGMKNLGVNGSVTWESGSRIRSLDDQDGSTVRFSSLTKLGLEFFADLCRSSEVDNPGSFRLKFSIDNLFNQRRRVTGYPGYDEILSDPYGRTIRVDLRKAI